MRADRIASGVRAVRQAAVIADQPTEIAQAVTTPKLPECLLPEEQILASSLSSRICQRGHHRRRQPRMGAGGVRTWRGDLLLRRAQAVHEAKPGRRVARLERCLCFDETSVDTGHDCHGGRLAPDLDLDDERAPVLGLHGVAAVARKLVIRWNARILGREERNGVSYEDRSVVPLDAVTERVPVRAEWLRPEGVIAAGERRG